MFKRCFVALPIPEEIIDEIQTCQIGLSNAKWTKRENLHITLHFIGEIPIENFRMIQETLKEVQGKAFSIRIKNPKVFYKKNQQILWLGNEPNEPIISLRNQILKIIQKFVPPYKKEEYVPHLTIARLDRTDRKNLNNYLLTYENFSTKEFMINSFGLYSSILHPKGAIYTQEEIYYLEDHGI